MDKITNKVIPKVLHATCQNFQRNIKFINLVKESLKTNAHGPIVKQMTLLLL